MQTLNKLKLISSSSIISITKIIVMGLVLFTAFKSNAQCPPSPNDTLCGAIKPALSAIVGSTKICASGSVADRTVTFNFTTGIKVDRVCISFGPSGPTQTVIPTDTNISFTHTFSFPQSNFCSDDPFQPPYIFDVVASFYKNCSGGNISFDKLSQQVTIVYAPRPKIANISTQCLNNLTCINVAACASPPLVSGSLCSCTNAYPGGSGSYTWDFGDGNSQTFNNITDNLYQSICHTYQSGGSYKVKLIATNQCGTRVDSIQNVIISKVDSLMIATSGPYCTGDAVTLNLSGSGNGTFSTSVTQGPSTPLPTPTNPSSKNPSIKFPKSGNYTITVRYGSCVIDLPIDIDEGVNMAQTPIPDQCFNENNTLNLVTHFQSTAQTQTNKITVLDSLGNTIYSNTFTGTPTQTNIPLPNTGKYIVIDTSITTCNTLIFKDTFLVLPLISPTLPPDTSICLQSFYNVPNIPGTILSGDTNAPGFFLIKDNVTYNFIYTPVCGNPATLKITGIGVKALAKDSTYCSSPGIITLTGTHYGMIFCGTNVSGNQLAASSGTHEFCTSYTDTLTGCVYKDTGIIKIEDPQAVSSDLPDTVCINNLVDTKLQGGGNFQVTWGDGTVNNSSTHTYSTSGTKHIQIKFTQAGCDTTLFDSVVVIPSPSPQFTLTPSDTICEGDLVTVTATQNPLFDYTWVVTPQITTTDTPPQFTGVNPDKVPIENTVTLTITSRQCSAATTSQTIIVNPATKAFMALNYDSVCSPVTLKISNNSIVSTTGITIYEWFKNDSLISGGKDFYDNIVADPDPVTVTYKLRVTSCGKTDSVSRTITVYPADFNPSLYVSTEQGCINTPICFTASAILNCTVSYDFGDGTFSGQVSSFDEVCHEYKTPGKYCPNVTMYCECKIKSDGRCVTINPGPEITVQATPQTCTDSLIRIYSQSIGAVTPNNYYAYFGDGDTVIGDKDPSHAYNLPDTYNGWMVAVGGTYNCPSNPVPFTIKVLEKPKVDFANTDTFACSEILTLFKVDSASSNTTYEWQIIYDNQATFTTTFDGILPLYAEKEGKYKVVLTAYNNNNIACKSVSDTLRLTLFPTPTADFSTDVAYVIGEENTFQLINKTKPDNISYFWDFGDESYSNLLTPNPKRYNQTGSYLITLAATTGPCSDTANQEVKVFPNLKVYFPNTFSPNGDGFNDFLELYGNINDIDFLRIKIFNRFGEKLFETEDKNFKWDGNYNGKALLPDVFVYTLEISIIGDAENRLLKGSITLIK